MTEVAVSADGVRVAIRSEPYNDWFVIDTAAVKGIFTSNPGPGWQQYRLATDRDLAGEELTRLADTAEEIVSSIEWLRRRLPQAPVGGAS